MQLLRADERLPGDDLRDGRFGMPPARGAADPHFCHTPLQDGSRQVPVCDRTAGVDL